MSIKKRLCLSLTKEKDKFRLKTVYRNPDPSCDCFVVGENKMLEKDFESDSIVLTNCILIIFDTG